MASRGNNPRDEVESDGDSEYRQRSRDRRQAQGRVPASKRESADAGELSLPKVERHGRTNEAINAKFHRVRASGPLQSKLNGIFGTSIDAAEALAFVKQHGSFCSAVLITDMLGRIERGIGFVPFGQPEKLLSFIPVFKELFSHFAHAESNTQPREVSTCLRLAGRLHGLLGKVRSQSQYDTSASLEQFETFHSSLLRLWSKTLAYEAAHINTTDCIDAIEGISGDKGLFNSQMHSAAHKAGRRIDELLKATCDLLCDKLESGEPCSLPNLVGLLRHLAVEAFASGRLTRVCNELFWTHDGAGRTAFDTVTGDSEALLPLKLSALGGTASPNVDYGGQLVRVERDLAEIVATGRLDLISADMIADFVVASVASKYRPDDELVHALEVHLPTALQSSPRGTHETSRARYYATLGIMILRETPEQSTVKIAGEVAGMVGSISSLAEHHLGSLLSKISRRWDLRVAREVACGPCSLDFLVVANGSPHGPRVNVELDGLPFHSVFMIDEPSAQQAEVPLKQILRDMLVEQRGDIRVVRITTNELYAQPVEERECFLESRILPVLEISPYES